MNKNYTRASHGFGPVYDEKSRILILGSFPSVKSREEGFFYGHPRNRFWKILTAVCDVPEPVTIEEKKRLSEASQIQKICMGFAMLASVDTKKCPNNVC